MTTAEKLTHVDRWMTFRRRLIADADCMKLEDNGIYEFISPIGNAEGPSEIFNVRLNELSDEELVSTVQKIKMSGFHTEWPYVCPDKVHLAIHGEIPVHPLKDLVLGIMSPEDVPCYPDTAGDMVIRNIVTRDDFALWCDINRFDFGSFNANDHFHLVKEGKLNCFLSFVDGKHAAISAILNDEGAAALDFIHVLPDYRKKGVATALSRYSIRFACELGVKFIISFGWPEISPGSYRLFEKLGFNAITSDAI